MKKMHSPERTCVICKSKKLKSQLFRIAEKDGEYVLDEKQTIQARGQYVCKEHNCIQRLSKHKKLKVSFEELLKMLNLLKKESKDYLKIFKAMKNSGELSFGINMIFDEIEKIHFIVIANDISEKNNQKLIEKAREKNIPFVHYGEKRQLGEVFGKDEINVIAIKNKKVARGLIE
ncbi:DUF448 domain-containing protein [Fusobacterium sp.]|uniref:DUF448 domain-containing protein n=1 Tax=Fusobacterium sp. TaxID=68766 RepID=UPI002625C1B4|nr:DUF448 domain-containing protein [Fusobacterium sp.]